MAESMKLMRELAYKVTHLSEKIEKVGSVIDKHNMSSPKRTDPSTDELRGTVVQLQANIDCLYREQMETAPKPKVLVHHRSLRLDRSVCGRAEH